MESFVRIAVIPPTTLLDRYAKLGDAYHLCLSSEVLSTPSYADFYRRCGQEGDYVILDNSAHEQLEGQSLQQLLTATAWIRPNEVVLPDRLFFGDDTVERSTEAYSQFRSLFPDVKLMGVPQGRWEPEWLECLERLVHLGVDTIGISKDYEVWPSGLYRLVQFVRSHGYDSTSIHLLGWGRELWQLSGLESLVRGVDSAKPIVYAQNGVELPYELTQSTTPKYPGRRPTFFDEFSSGSLKLDRIVRHNVDVFRFNARGCRYATGGIVSGRQALG